MATKIFVTGASGHVGSHTVRHHVKLNQDKKYVIKAAAPHIEKERSVLQDLTGQVEILKFDATVKETWELVKGCDCMLIVPPATQNRVEVALQEVEAAKSAGVKFICLLSVADIDNKQMGFGQQFQEIENAITKSGIPHCFMRAAFFMENFLGICQHIKEKGEFSFNVKSDAKFAPIACDDIGKACAFALVDCSKHQGQKYTLTGGELVCCNDVASMMTKLVGKDVKFKQSSVDEAKACLNKAGVPDWQSKGVVELWCLVDQNKSAQCQVSPHFQQITNSKPITLQNFFQEHASCFK